MMFLAALSVLALPANVVLAGEHGGTAVQGQEHGGQTVTSDTGETTFQGTKDDAADIKKAADMVRGTDPELASRLEKMAQEQCGL